MPRFNVAITFGLLFFSMFASAQELQISRLRADPSTNLRVGVMEPDAHAYADVLFLHGFADRMDNHLPLFRELTAANLRVISFDLPSHGGTRASSLGWYSFDDLADLAGKVESSFGGERPLVLIGWSTGGLLAIRMAQNNFENSVSRTPESMVLLAPGVSVYKLPGRFGLVTQESLTSHPQPPHAGPISPLSPLLMPGFSLRLLGNSIWSNWRKIPADLPTLTVIGGNSADVYAKSPGVRSWVRAQRGNNGMMSAIQCKSAKHALDNEIEPIGATVRKAVVDYIVGVNSHHPIPVLSLDPASGCASF